MRDLKQSSYYNIDKNVLTEMIDYLVDDMSSYKEKTFQARYTTVGSQIYASKIFCE